MQALTAKPVQVVVCHKHATTVALASVSVYSFTHASSRVVRKSSVLEISSSSVAIFSNSAGMASITQNCYCY